MKKLIFFANIIIFTFMAAKSQQEARFMRFPAIHNDKIVFSYAGDLYVVSLEGGVARQLTSHVGNELFPRFSPDGKYIAFSGQYDGNTEVYVIPAEGGVPKRLTFTATLDRDDVADRMGPNNIVMTWTPDGKKIVFRSRNVSFNDFIGQLYYVDLNGNLPEPLPFVEGGFCSFSPDGKAIAFNKIFREFRTWKYYKGGMADDIWIYEFDTKKCYKIFQNDAQDIIPMWYKDKIFFISDRNRTMNLFVYDINTKEVKQVTNFTDYDIKFPSLGSGKIVFEKGGELYYYDIEKDIVKKVPVYINNDIVAGYNRIVDASKNITWVSLSPKNDFLLFSARGEIFKVPAIKGVTKNISNSIGSHERCPLYSPDGKYIAFISDKSGEYEVYIQKSDLSEPPIQLTKNTKTYIYRIMWSPNSKYILYNDRLYNLYCIDVEKKELKLIDKSDYFEIHEFSWSPDSRYVVYSLPVYGMYNKLLIHDLQTSQKITVSDGWYPASNAVFSTDGKYLVFASGRTFKPTYDDLDWNVVFNNLEKIYIVLLSKDTPNPLAPKESFSPTPEEDKDTANNNFIEKNSEEKTIEVKIDADGLTSRIIEVPIRPSNYYNISCVKNRIYYLQKDENSQTNTFYYYDLVKQEEKKLGTDLTYTLSYDAKKILIKKDDKYAVIDLPTSEINFGEVKYADLSGMKFRTDFRQEFKQIFDESWRQMRDYFYAPNMHGVDWQAIYKKYAALLPYVNHRNDLTYLIGEMIGELNVGHAYVGGGDRPSVQKVYTGLLGAQFSKDKKTGYFKIEKLLLGAPWDKSKASPLAFAGVKEGEYIIAINGIETKNYNNIYELLVNTAERPTEITVNSTPSKQNSRNVIVEPLKSEAELYYFEWVKNNIEYVNKKTNGQVGYIHIPDMSWKGMATFVEYFYPQISKKALIIDDRGNGGGNVSPIITEILRRQIVFHKMWRNTPMAGPVPEKTHLGPKVILINEYSASDGDLFPYQFKYYKIGKAIGKRTWGGVIGIRGSLPFIDGGYLNKPEFGHYSADGKTWIIEGYGVDPDIVVENNPAEVFQGKDVQLDKAIEIILEELKNNPSGLLPPPPYPDKSK